MSFYRMHRGWMDSEIWDKAPFSEREAWEWMIGEALWKPGIRNILGKPTMLQRGQFSHSIRFMADKFQWSKKKLECYLSKLLIWDMIKTDSGTGQNVITICNYNIYQVKDEDQGDSLGDSRGTAGGQQGDKEEELSNKVKKEDVVVLRARATPAEYVAVGKNVISLMGLKNDPRWTGNYSRVGAWIDAGFDPDLDIYPTIRRLVAAKGTGPPIRTLEYFEQAIADTHAARTKPVRQGNQNGTYQQKLTKHDRLEIAGNAAVAEIIAAREKSEDLAIEGPSHAKL